MNAYDSTYLEKARISLGIMLDYAVNVLNYKLRNFWDIFLDSDISQQFEHGDTGTIAGKSGVEIALELSGKSLEEKPIPVAQDNKSPEYWAGWALAYYQWSTGYSFVKIDRVIAIDDVVRMYFPYHEMDIRQFCDRLNELMRGNHYETNLKRIRRTRGLTQTQLSEQTSIPLRTIQQYEQGQKNINGARSEYLITLSRALYCDADELLEIN